MSSDVARTRQAIEDEAWASWQALYGLRQGGAEHRVIEAQLTRFIDDLADKVGSSHAAYEIIASFDRLTPQDTTGKDTSQ